MVGLEFLLNFSWLVTFVAVVAICFASVRHKALLAVFTVLVNVVATSWPAFLAISGETVVLSLQAGSFLGDVPVRIDGLSAWFILIINFTSATGVVYGMGYLKAYSENSVKLALHWGMFVLFHLSMVWVCMLQNGFAFLIAWEIMSLTSMLLVIFDHNNPKTLKAGLNYLVQMHLSVVFLTIGFIWIYLETGSLSFDAIEAFFSTNNNIWLFLIFFLGFGLKAGFIPLHSWLPHAHPAAPSHVSGVMSGVIVKLGIYGIFRVISFLKADFLLLGEIVVTLSVLTGLYGILNAAVYRDFKRMLAYCTIENIGIIGIGIGIGLMGMGENSPLMYYLGFGGALLHVLNHSLFKSLLFYSAGSVYRQTYTRDMDQLGGLIKQMPQTAVFFLIGAIAIGGVPPFNGFVSEFIIYSGLLEGIQTGSLNQIGLMVLTFAGLSIIGGISILTFTKTFGTIFLGNGRKKMDHQPEEVPLIMLLPQYLIAGLMLSVAFLPQFYLGVVNNLLSGMCRFVPAGGLSEVGNYGGTLTQISLYSALFIVIVAVSWGIRLLLRNKQQAVQPTWGCAYVAPNTRMQYTGKSFSKQFGKIFSFLLVEKKHYKELQSGDTFPGRRKYKSRYLDLFEKRLIDVVVQRLIYAANYFKFIQNGRIQSYVLYGIVFMLSIFVLTVLTIVR